MNTAGIAQARSATRLGPGSLDQKIDSREVWCQVPRMGNKVRFKREEVFDGDQIKINKYQRPGLNRRPSACKADVITTTPR